MFSYLAATGTLALRLAPADREAFIERFRTGLHEAYGIVQKEYVTVPDEVLDDTATLAPYLAASYAYVSALKPKPTTRRKGSRLSLEPPMAPASQKPRRRRGPRCPVRSPTEETR
jgi:hypothetical protein